MRVVPKWKVSHYPLHILLSATDIILIFFFFQTEVLLHRTIDYNIPLHYRHSATTKILVGVINREKKMPNQILKRMQQGEEASKKIFFFVFLLFLRQRNTTKLLHISLTHFDSSCWKERAQKWNKRIKCRKKKNSWKASKNNL